MIYAKESLSIFMQNDSSPPICLHIHEIKDKNAYLCNLGSAVKRWEYKEKGWSQAQPQR